MKPIWRFFSSVRLAVILILILAVLSLAGSLIVQMPMVVSSDPALVNNWLENTARPIFGFSTDFLAFLGIFDLFHSPLFLVVGGLLVISIVFCTLNRWKSLYSSFKRASIKRAVRLASLKNDPDLITDLPSDNVSKHLISILEKRGYKTRQKSEIAWKFIAGDRNRYSVWGSYLIHASLVLFIIGYLLSSYLSFSDDAFIVKENTVRRIENGSGLSLGLISFEDEYYPDGTPKDYRSKVVVFSGDEIITEGTVRVNHPLVVNSLKIFQSFYGHSVGLKITDEHDITVFQDSVLLNRVLESVDVSRPYGIFALEALDIFGYIIGPSIFGQDSLIALDEFRLELYSKSGESLDWVTLKVGESTEILGLAIEPELIEYFSGFQLRQDPGINYIWAASGCFLVGLIAVFYFPHRKLLCAIVNEGQDTKVWIDIKASKQQSAGQEKPDIIDELNLEIENDIRRSVTR